jgi:death-on-curing protein
MHAASQSATTYLTLADVLAMHDAVTERTGAAYAPLRDDGLLDSALTRPRYAAHYGGADLARQATVLGIGISQAQAFVDGNKRTAYAAVEVFLDTNGLRLTGDPLELARAFEAVASRSDDLEAATERFEAWLRERVTPTRA